MAKDETQKHIAVRICGDVDVEITEAITRALEQNWPKQLGLNEAPPSTTRWRYSGRWWAQGRLDPR